MSIDQIAINHAHIDISSLSFIFLKHFASLVCYLNSFVATIRALAWLKLAALDYLV